MKHCPIHAISYKRRCRFCVALVKVLRRVTVLLFMLVIMGERWVAIGNAPLKHIPCPETISVEAFCSEALTIYQRVYVIGAMKNAPKDANNPAGGWYADSITEKFIIPIPDAPLKHMRAEEAEKLNKELMR